VISQKREPRKYLKALPNPIEAILRTEEKGKKIERKTDRNETVRQTERQKERDAKAETVTRIDKDT
jgi:hypothetical protein